MKAAIFTQQLIALRGLEVAPHMIYLPQTYFITNHVTTSLYIFYCSKSVKGNNNKKRRTRKTKMKKLLEDFAG